MGKHMITGVGVDIVNVERFENYAAEPEARFMQRVFTPRERKYLQGKHAQPIAGIFAAKEAVSKAIGTGFNGFSPSDIEILHKENGKPYVILHNGAKKAVRRFSKIHISISHTKTDAVAYAILELQ